MASVETRTLETSRGTIYFPEETLNIDSGQIDQYSAYRTTFEIERVLVSTVARMVPTALWIGGATLARITEFGLPTYEVLRTHSVKRLLEIQKFPKESRRISTDLYRRMTKFAATESANLDVLFHPDDKHTFTAEAERLVEKHRRENMELVVEENDDDLRKETIYRTHRNIPAKTDKRRYILGFKRRDVSRGRLPDDRSVMVWSSVRYPIHTQVVDVGLLDIPMFRLRVMPVSPDDGEMRLNLGMNRLGLYAKTNSGEIFDVVTGQVVPPRLWHTLTEKESLRAASNQNISPEITANAVSRAIYNWARGAVVPDHVARLVYDSVYRREMRKVAIDGYQEAVGKLVDSWPMLSSYMRERVVMRLMGSFEIEPKYFNSIILSSKNSHRKSLDKLFPNFADISEQLSLAFENHLEFKKNRTSMQNTDLYNGLSWSEILPPTAEDASGLIRNSVDQSFLGSQKKNLDSNSKPVANSVMMSMLPSSIEQRSFPWLWELVKQEVAVGKFDFLSTYDGSEFVSWLFQTQQHINE